MDEPQQPTLVLALLVDAAGAAQLGFKRYDPVSGQQISAGTINLQGIVQTLGALEDVLQLGFIPELGQRTALDQATSANTRTLPCGCVISTTGTAPLRECERHQYERRMKLRNEGRSHRA
jgi:hypothetical protein